MRGPVIHDSRRFLFFLYKGLIVFTVLTTSCDDNESLTILPRGDHSVFIVCEGNYGTENSTLVIIDTSYTDTVHRDVFYRVNQRRLGSHAHRMIMIDSSGIIMVTQSDRIELINANTFEYQAGISVRSPRDAAYYGSRVFVTSYVDSQIVIIAYPQWTIEQTIKIPHKPDCIVLTGNKLLIGNSGALYSSNLQDSTITIMDADNPLSHHTIFIGKTPVSIAVSQRDQKAYIACKGSTVASGSIAVLDLQNEQITSRIGTSDGIRPVMLAIYDSLLACIRNENGSVRIYNRLTGMIHMDDINVNAYALGFCAGELLIADARDYISPGRIFWYDTNYRLKNTYKTGIAPAHICCK